MSLQASSKHLPRWTTYFYAVLTLTLFLSCTNGELHPLVENDGGTSSDTDSDSDTDTNTGPPTSCPLNSGYPCACDIPGEGTCNDLSDCLVRPEDSLGFCSRRCGVLNPQGDCLPTQGWGVPAPSGWCGLNAANPDSPIDFGHCVVICETKDASGPCPPELECHNHPAIVDPPHSICLPFS